MFDPFGPSTEISLRIVRLFRLHLRRWWTDAAQCNAVFI
jgi:hypothetical protein